MADDSENQTPAEEPASETPKAKTTKAKATALEGQPAEAVVIPEAAPTAAAGAPAPVKTEAKPKTAKKSPRKAEVPAAEAPKENLSLDPNDVEKPKIIKAKG